MAVDVILLFIASGLLGGFLAGLLGIGGGIIYVAIFAEVFILKEIPSEEIVKFTLANSLAIISITSLIASLQQIKSKNFNFIWVGITTLFATFFSVLITLSIIYGTWYKPEYFNTFYLIILLFSLYNIWESVILKKEKVVIQDSFHRAPIVKLSISGAATSIISSLTGLGGGVVFVPLVHKWIKIPIKSATSLAQGALTLPTLAIALLFMFSGKPSSDFYNVQIGFLIPEIVLPIIAGVTVAAPLGVKASQKLNEKLIKIIFSALIVIIATKTIYIML